MGDASVAVDPDAEMRMVRKFQSPSHGGRFCCWISRSSRTALPFVSVPFPWGTLLLRFAAVPATLVFRHVSVPFPWGTLLLRSGSMQAYTNMPKFQSPSHGGRFCCVNCSTVRLRQSKCFSPLPMGDASVATAHRLQRYRQLRFSPLPMGDASVAQRPFDFRGAL